MLNQLDIKLVAEKQIDIDRIEDIKFVHSNVRYGFFSDTVTTFDAIRFDGEIYRLIYDIGTKEWYAEREIKSPPQTAYYVDYVRLFKEKLNGWELSETEC